jgi:hypothetical protein
MLSVVLLAAGGAVATGVATLAGIVVGAGLGGLGALVGVRLVRRSRAERLRRLPHRGDPGQSIARSA